MPQPVDPSLDAAFLGDLADSLARAVADNGGGVLVHIAVAADDLDVGILPLDGVAPADLLFGAMAPPEWALLGVATLGWARPLDRRRAARRARAAVVVLVTRDGRVIGRVRQGDTVFTDPPAWGVTLDCLQRALGLPTAPPEPSTDGATDWARLRQVVVAGGWPEAGITPEEASWLDDGSFSRWVTTQGRTPRRGKLMA